MHFRWLMPASILTGMCMLAASSFSQTYTISAKPGALNFIQGDVSVNGEPVWTSNVKSTFLKANDVIAVKNGKAEVLLTPGVFLRLGENATVRMIKPSLIETQLEVQSGESMIEVDDMEVGTSVAVMDHGSSTTLTKPGLFRFNETTIASLEGKADVAFGERRLELKKNHQVEIGEALTASKVDLNQGDDLFAWSNTRAQYNAAATYAGSTSVYNSGGYGFSSYNSPGWYWNSPFNSYMWLPSNGAFYSPFGWGFYGPGLVAYAPVMAFGGLGYGYGYGYGTGYGYRGGVATTATAVKPTGTTASPVMVPVNPRSVGVSNFNGNSPAAFASARSQMQQSANYYGLHTARGGPAADIRGGQTFANMHAAVHAAAASAHQSASTGSAAGGGYAGNAGSANLSSRSAAPSASSSVGHASSGGGGHK